MPRFQKVYMVDLLAFPPARLAHSVVDRTHLLYNLIGSLPLGQKLALIGWY